MGDWPAPELLAVYDPVRAEVPAKEAPRAWAAVPDGELRARQERIQMDVSELAARGIYVFGYTAAGEVRYFSMDQERGELLIRERFGADASLRYLGASRLALRPHPFGSWLAEDRTLHVFYALPNNGEQPGGCVVAEREDCVIVALTIVDGLGAKTLIGGFTPSHLSVELDAELGDRAVVDNFDNRARPHWKTAAEVPLPRPQDL
jgi:hypothetical protein